MARQEFIKNSKVAEFTYWLQLDMLNVDKLYPNGMKLTFVFENNSSEWCLMDKVPVTTPATSTKPAMTATQNKYKIVIEDMHMQMRKLELTDNLLLDHERTFSKNQLAMYPFNASLVKKFTVQKGQTTEYFPAAIAGKLPTQVFLVMTETAADLGHINKNPFNFRHFDLSRAALSVDVQLKKEYRCGFKTDQIDDLLSAFYQNVTVHNSNSGVVVNREYFKGGCTCLLYTSPSPRDKRQSRMPSSA